MQGYAAHRTLGSRAGEADARLRRDMTLVGHD